MASISVAYMDLVTISAVTGFILGAAFGFLVGFLEYGFDRKPRKRRARAS